MALAGMLFCLSAMGQVGQPIFQPADGPAGPGYRTVSLDQQQLKSALAAGNAMQRGALHLSLPMPSGEWVAVEFLPSKLLPAALAAKYPNLQVWEGASVDGKYSFRGDNTVNGFHAQLIGGGETYYIDPAPELGAEAYRVYARTAYGRMMGHLPEFTEPEVPGMELAESKKLPGEFLARSETSFGGDQITYRIAIAASGEYTAFHGGTVEAGLSGVVTSLNRVSGIFQSEIGVTFTLVEDNDLIIYTNASGDPYSNSSPSTLLDENQANLDNVIGSANYDIGHVFTTASGGVAWLGSTCSVQNKAKGTTGTSTPTDDGFDVDFVAHEIGHQMGALHTFNGTQGSCSGGNRSGSAAYEPGSASTIMGYANICGSDNIQPYSDDYFHVKSLQQMSEHARVLGGLGCGTHESDGNTAPVVTMPEGGWVIPANTPFALTGSATDVDDDVLTYCWEQWDLGPAGSPNNPQGNAPLFRSFLPTEEPTRWFPQRSDVLSGSSTYGEKIPDYARDLNFMLTVRDGNGAASYESISMSVTEDAGPFDVIAPLAGISVSTHEAVQVTWDVANTDVAPVSVSEVSIWLSTDGGDTFTHELAAATANDGAEYVIIPAGSATSQALIRVAAVGNVFYDFNPGTFTIAENSGSGFSALLQGVPAVACVPNDVQFEVSTEAFGGFSGNISVALEGLDANLSGSLSASSITVGETVVITVSNTQNGSEGQNTFDIVLSADGVQTITLNAAFVLSQEVGEVTQLFPGNKETSVSPSPEFQWNADPYAIYYDVEVATDAAFANVIASIAGTADTLWNSGVTLDASTVYYWRVRAANSCGIGSYASAEFKTINLECTTASPSDLPISIDNNGGVTYESQLSVSGLEGTVYSVAVTGIDITHSWVQDLTLSLVHNNGSSATLIDQICSGEDDILVNFSDNGESASNIPCPPVDEGTYQPEQPLSVFEGADVAGPWTFRVVDNAAQDGGVITAWNLEVCVSSSDMTLTSTLTDDETVDLSWTVPSSGTVATYEVQVSVNGATYGTLTTTDMATTTYQHTGLAVNTEYSYRVRALLDDDSYSDFSNVSTQRTPDVAPNAPSGLLVSSVLDGQAELSWVDNSNNEDGFIVQRSSDNVSFETVGTVGRNISFYADRNQRTGTTNYYRVAAYNAVGISDYTEVGEIVVTNIPGIPEEALVLYPNPGSGQMTLKLDGYTPAQARVVVLNAQGQRVYLGDWNNTQAEMVIPTTHYASGMYLVQVQTEDAVITQRWVKQ